MGNAPISSIFSVRPCLRAISIIVSLLGSGFLVSSLLKSLANSYKAFLFFIDCTLGLKSSSFFIYCSITPFSMIHFFKSIFVSTNFPFLNLSWYSPLSFLSIFFSRYLKLVALTKFLSPVLVIVFKEPPNKLPVATPVLASNVNSWNLASSAPIL